MGYLLENARTAGRGATAIFLSNILFTLIQAVGAIIIIRLLSPTQYGLYTVAAIPASMVMLFSNWGVTSTMTKYIAQYRAEGKERDINAILRSGMLFSIGLSVILTSIAFFLSDFLAGFVLLKPEAALVVKVSCLMVLGTQLYNACWSTFLGFEEMRYGALMQILFAVAKTLLALLLVVLGFEALGASIGLSLGNLIAGGAGALMVLFAFYRPLRRIGSDGSMGSKEALRMMLIYGLPLAVVSIVGGFGSQFYSFLMARYSSTLSICNYGVALTFTVLVGFITFPISNVLFPAFSKLCGADARKELEDAFGASVKYASFLVLPAAVGVMALSQPIVGVLFGGQYEFAPPFLVLLSVGSLLCGLGSLSVSTLLQSQGKTKEMLIIGLLTLLVGVPFSFVLIPPFGILGFIVNSLVAQATGTVLYIYWVRKLFKFNTWVNQSVRTYVAAFTMGGLMWVTLNALMLWIGIDNDAILLGAGIVVGFISYLLILPLIGAIESTDLENLSVIIGKIRFLTPVFNILLAIMKRMIAIRSRKSS